MSSTWEIMLARRPPDVAQRAQDAIRFFDESGAFGSYVSRNLTADRFLSEKAADQFINLFLTFDPSAPLHDFKQQFLNTCYSNALCGDEIGLRPYPEQLGRAVDKAGFINNVVSAKPISKTAKPITKRTLERILDKLESGKLRNKQRKVLSDLPMSQHAAWVTWDRESGGRQRPFSFLRRSSPYDLRNALGLPLDNSAMQDLPLLTFEYTSQAVHKLYRPTTADAASCLRFAVRPPPPPAERNWFGLTVPWPDHPKSDTSEIDYPPKRPEALHGQIPFPDEIKCKTLNPEMRS